MLQMANEPDLPPQPSGEMPKQAGFLRVLGAVFAAFLGIRKRSSGERDEVTIKALHVIVAGVLSAAVLVALLVLLVRSIAR
ncbi:MAG TPA: DUF2970 domain-containing protein [Casimicrobiaceae bacterium]|nr:DUF2970 domain-containing protein [Casimicrobiaceae bacterium]